MMTLARTRPREPGGLSESARDCGKEDAILGRTRKRRKMRQIIVGPMVSSIKKGLQRSRVAEAAADHDRRHAGLEKGPSVLAFDESIGPTAAIDAPTKPQGLDVDDCIQPG